MTMNDLMFIPGESLPAFFFQKTSPAARSPMYTCNTMSHLVNMGTGMESLDAIMIMLYVAAACLNSSRLSRWREGPTMSEDKQTIHQIN